mmetsp:Transcript_164/g.283  ORF Transcript_164/g.283 Transcript_164/m.283 type:complete len:100 (+) Transcript_164:1865-2164(+)
MRCSSNSQDEPVSKRILSSGSLFLPIQIMLARIQWIREMAGAKNAPSDREIVEGETTSTRNTRSIPILWQRDGWAMSRTRLVDSLGKYAGVLYLLGSMS